MHRVANRLDLFVRRLLFRKFETVELVLALSIFFHGAWLLFPYWTPGGNPTEISRSLEIATALAMLSCGAVHVPLVLHDWRRRIAYPFRKVLSMTSFMGHAYLLFLVVMVSGMDTVFAIPYTALTLLGALAYLSMTVTPYE